MNLLILLHFETKQNVIFLSFFFCFFRFSLNCSWIFSLISFYALDTNSNVCVCVSVFLTIFLSLLSFFSCILYFALFLFFAIKSKKNKYKTRTHIYQFLFSIKKKLNLSFSRIDFGEKDSEEKT